MWSVGGLVWELCGKPPVSKKLANCNFTKGGFPQSFHTVAQRNPRTVHTESGYNWGRVTHKFFWRPKRLYRLAHNPKRHDLLRNINNHQHQPNFGDIPPSWKRRRTIQHTEKTLRQDTNPISTVNQRNHDHQFIPSTFAGFYKGRDYWRRKKTNVVGSVA